MYIYSINLNSIFKSKSIFKLISKKLFLISGYKIFLPKLRKTELPVKILPSLLAADIRSEEAEILELTGGKGNSLALLASLKSEEVPLTQ